MSEQGPWAEFINSLSSAELAEMEEAAAALAPQEDMHSKQIMEVDDEVQNLLRINYALVKVLTLDLTKYPKIDKKQVMNLYKQTLQMSTLLALSVDAYLVLHANELTDADKSNIVTSGSLAAVAVMGDRDAFAKEYREFQAMLESEGYFDRMLAEEQAEIEAEVAAMEAKVRENG